MDGDAAVDGGRHRSRRVLVGAALALVVIGAVIVLRVPSTKPPAGFGSSSQAVPDDVAVVVYLRVDSFDASKATMAARVSAGPGPALPAGGARVKIGDEGRAELVVGSGSPSAEQSVVLDVDRGSVSSYPFDDYELDESVAAVAATRRQHRDPRARRRCRSPSSARRRRSGSTSTPPPASSTRAASSSPSPSTACGRRSGGPSP